MVGLSDHTYSFHWQQDPEKIKFESITSVTELGEHGKICDRSAKDERKTVNGT